MNFIKKKIRKFLFFLIYPLIIIIEIIKPIKLIKLCQIKTAFIGTNVQEVDAYFFHKIDYPINHYSLDISGQEHFQRFYRQ